MTEERLVEMLQVPGMVTGFHSPWVEPAERELAESEYGIDDPEYRFRDVLALIVKLPALKRLQAGGNGLDRRLIVWRRLRQRFAAVNDERRRTTKTLKTSIYAAFRVIGERRRIGLWRRESAQGVEKSAWFQRFEAPVWQATHASTHATGGDTHLPRWTLIDDQRRDGRATACPRGRPK